MSLSALEPNLNEIVKEYLDSCGYARTSSMFNNECLELGKPQPTSPSIVLRKSTLLNIQIDMMEHFRSGEQEEFFELWNHHLPDKILQEDTIALKLEFYLHVHFFAYKFKHHRENSHVCEEASRTLRQYLEGRGSPLSQNPEFLHFYALPFTPDPRNHSSFRDLFTGHWVADLDLRVARYLQLVLDPGETTLEYRPQLLELYSGSAVKDRAMFRMVKDEAKDADRRCKVFRRHSQRIQADYHTLIGITADLVDTLKSLMSGRHVNQGHLEGLCRRLAVAQTLDYHYSIMDLEIVDSPPSQRPRSEDIADVLDRGDLQHRGHLVEGLDRSGRVSHMATQYELEEIQPSPRPTTVDQQPKHTEPLNFDKICRDLKQSSVRRKCFLLQALRWRLSRNPPFEAGVNLTAFIHHDILGCRTGAGSRRETYLDLITSQEIMLRESSARLVNAIASFNRGRSYLSNNTALVIGMIERLHHESGESVMRKNLIGALQKLSLRRSMQTLMIQGGLISWLETLLVNRGKGLTDYALEYSVALLMNLCLRTLGKQECANNPERVLRVLVDLMGHDNREILPYVNGALYSLLLVPVNRETARNMNLENSLSKFFKNDNSDLDRQLDFIIRQIQTTDQESDRAASGDENDDEDDEEDILEPDVDFGPDIEPASGGELSGDLLLSSEYTKHTNEKTPSNISNRKENQSTVPTLNLPTDDEQLSIAMEVSHRPLSAIPSNEIPPFSSRPVTPANQRVSSGKSQNGRALLEINSPRNERISLKPKSPEKKEVEKPKLIPKTEPTPEYLKIFSAKDRIPR